MESPIEDDMYPPDNGPWPRVATILEAQRLACEAFVLHSETETGSLIGDLAERREISRLLHSQYLATRWADRGGPDNAILGVLTDLWESCSFAALVCWQGFVDNRNARAEALRMGKEVEQ